MTSESNNSIVSPTATVASQAPNASPTQATTATNTVVPTGEPPTQTVIPTQPSSILIGKIAFQSYGDGNSEIYIMNSDGSGQINLTVNSSHDKHPAWSPDGKKIAFDSNRDGNYQIYVMNADGSGQNKLTTQGANLTPAWSRDGKQIAFASYRDGGYMALYVMNADGSGQTRLTDNKADHWFPTWSPDSKRIAFSSNSPSPGTTPYSIFIINEDGSDLKIATIDAHANDGSPNWSPDGKWIAYTRAVSPSREDIMLVNPIDSAIKGLTGITAHENCPSWSPDNKWIAFSSDRDGNFEIYVMHADGSGQTRLTNSPGDDWYPTWQPSQ
jgi:Tol biopolymer transport system component